MVIVALVFAVLLALEWRYRRAWLRLGIVALAVVVHVVATPSITVAARQATAAPPEARVRIFWGDTLSEYMSGVDQMREYMADQFDLTAGVRRVTLGVLVWLACEPGMRPPRSSRHAGPGDAEVDSGARTI